MAMPPGRSVVTDRKSTRLNSSHLGISYAVFCLKKNQHRLQGLSRRAFAGPGRRDHVPGSYGRWNSFLFFFNDTATTEIYTLSLHDALPISASRRSWKRAGVTACFTTGST